MNEVTLQSGTGSATRLFSMYEKTKKVSVVIISIVFVQWFIVQFLGNFKYFLNSVYKLLTDPETNSEEVKDQSKLSLGDLIKIFSNKCDAKLCANIFLVSAITIMLSLFIDNGDKFEFNNRFISSMIVLYFLLIAIITAYIIGYSIGVALIILEKYKLESFKGSMKSIGENTQDIVVVLFFMMIILTIFNYEIFTSGYGSVFQNPMKYLSLILLMMFLNNLAWASGNCYVPLDGFIKDKDRFGNTKEIIDRISYILHNFIFIIPLMFFFKINVISSDSKDDNIVTNKISKLALLITFLPVCLRVLTQIKFIEDLFSKNINNKMIASFEALVFYFTLIVILKVKDVYILHKTIEIVYIEAMLMGFVIAVANRKKKLQPSIFRSFSAMLLALVISNLYKIKVSMQMHSVIRIDTECLLLFIVWSLVKLVIKIKDTEIAENFSEIILHLLIIITSGALLAMQYKYKIAV